MNKTSGQTIVIVLIFFVALMFLVVSQQNDMEPEQTPSDSNEIFNEVSNTTTTVVLDNEELAENFDVVFYPFFLDGVAGVSDLNQLDGIHPTGEGVAEIVRRIKPYVKELISRIGNL